MKLLSFRESKHLVERTGIGCELDRIQFFSGKPLDFAVSRLLSADTKNNFTPPILLKPIMKSEIRKSGDRKLQIKTLIEERKLLAYWGIHNLLKTDNPLHERMIWFWHNHFTTSVHKVFTTDWVLIHDLSIRKYALGNFSDLLKAMTFDPAMLIYLDGSSNKKGQPNENFSRELLELFTLGEGNYTENDIKEAARAFTGWGLDLNSDKAVFRKRQHDSGNKTFMGIQGDLKGDDILSILLSQPRTAEYICEKLWYEFISIETPEPLIIKSWATVFRSSGYDIPSLLNTIFNSTSFWGQKHQGALIKSPIDLIIGSLRTLKIEDGDLPIALLRNQFRRMGQALYEPPNVKGWKGGKAWVDDVRLPIRQQFLHHLTRGKTGVRKNMVKNIKVMDNKMLGDGRREIPVLGLPDLPEQQWIEWLLAVPPITRIDAKQPQAKLKAILLDPAYQLK